MTAEALMRRRAKLMMRRRFKSHRASLPRSAVLKRSAALCERLLEHDLVRDATQVALFWPMERHKEVDLRVVDAVLRQRGVQVAYPATEDDGTLTFRLVSEVEAMILAPLGYRQPGADMPAADRLDVVVVPGLAFDSRGHRIGYGGGYYDRALPRYCPPATSIGVAFDFQLAADVPDGDGDVQVDLIITDSRTLVPNHGGDVANQS